MAIRNPEAAYREFTVELAPGERFTQHHIKAREADISRYVFIPGSHLRGRRMAERLDDCRVVSATRGYYVYSGYHQDVFITVCSTGMGGPVVAIAMEELGRMGADAFVRIGSAGGLQPHLGNGDIVVASATVRAGGTAIHYLPGNFPAAPDFRLTRELADAIERRHGTAHTGLVVSGDAFYGPRPLDGWDDYQRAGVLAIEMESDTQFIVGKYHGWRCAAAFVLDGGPAKAIGDSSAVGQEIAHHSSNPEFLKGESDLIDAALDAMAAYAQRAGK